MAANNNFNWPKKTSKFQGNIKNYQENHCSFCKKKGENAEVYMSHFLRDKTGLVVCPILRSYTCPVCKGNGDNAHTLKYCPYATKPWLMVQLTFGHWASLPLSIQSTLTKMAHECGFHDVDVIQHGSPLAAYINDPIVSSMPIAEVISSFKKGLLSMPSMK